MGFAAARPRGSMASRNGSATVAPRPCRTVRRGNDLVRKAMSLFSLIRPRQESGTFHDPENQGGPAVFMPRRVADDFAHGRLVVVVQPATNGVRQKLLRDGAGKLLGPLEEQRAKTGQPLHLGAADCRAARVDRLAG